MTEATETMDGGKPVIANAEKEIERSEAGHPIMKAVHVALLKEVAGKKEQIYKQIGLIEEAKHHALKDLDRAEAERQTLAKEIQEDYNLPADKMWQLNPQTREIFVTEAQPQPQ